MTSHCYKITDPQVVADYVAAREAFAQWRADGKAFLDSLGPAVYGVTSRHFTGEQSGLGLRLERGFEASDLPAGWRYVKTRGSVEPKLHAAGAAAREAYAPYEGTPPQPTQALKDHKIPTFLFDHERSMSYSAGHFEHDGVIYLTIGIPVDERNWSELLVPIKESEFVLAREAQDEAA